MSNNKKLFNKQTTEYYFQSFYNFHTNILYTLILCSLKFKSTEKSHICIHSNVQRFHYLNKGLATIVEKSSHKQFSNLYKASILMRTTENKVQKNVKRLFHSNILFKNNLHI